MAGRKKKLISLRTTIWRFMVIFTAALVSYMSIFLGWNIRSYRKQTREEILTRLDDWSETVDNSVISLNSLLQSIYTYNPDFSELSTATTDAAKYTSAYKVLQSLRTYVNSTEEIAGIFVTYNQGNSCVYAMQQGITDADTKTLRSLASAEITTNYMSSLQDAEDDCYLVLYLQKSLAGAMGAVSLTRGMPEAESSDGCSMAVWLNGQLLTVSGEELTLPEELSEPVESGVYQTKDSLFFVSTYAATGLVMIEKIPRVLSLYYSPVHLAMIVLIAVTAAALILLTRYVRKQLADPLEDMTGALRQIQRGTWEAKFHAENRVQEIDDVKSAVNAMLKQIEQYKIEIYEERIDRQKAELQFLRLQLAPHFYTNCLKNAYYMLLLGETENAEQFLLKLSAHLRYLLSGSDELVSVQEELDFVQNYIDMQKLMTEKPLELKLITDQSVLKEHIPLLSIQTFVENSVKYGRDQDGKDLGVMVWVKRLDIEHHRYLDITVADNGAGYSPEMLKRLNAKQPESEGKNGVGIVNLLTRVRFRYGERASWYFRNEIGAVSELILPASFDRSGREITGGGENSADETDGDEGSEGEAEGAGSELSGEEPAGEETDGEKQTGGDPERTGSEETGEEEPGEEQTGEGQPGQNNPGRRYPR
ncbi:MAG: histidine kinase [Lachnospiraceae bacterium]|jgi:two-component system sensor histidine kinase YesM